MMEMDLNLLLILGAIALLLLFSGFFSSSETALTAANPARLIKLERDGNHKAKAVNQLLEGKERLIGAILLGNNAVNILASSLATSLMITLVGDSGVAYATLAMTLLILIFSEVLPKTYALHHADNFALRVAPVLKVVVFLLAPVTHLVQIIVTLCLKILGSRAEATYGAERWEEALRGAIELHRQETPDEEARSEGDMMRSILDLGDVDVSEIMVHRSKVATIDADLPSAEILDAVLSSPYTRIPLWRKSPDNIVSILHVKDLLRAITSDPEKASSLNIEEIATKPWFIPDTTDLLSQLQAFRARKEHFSIVVDEYGEMLGIVTLEDILEEIVGDISDEHDVTMEGVERLSDGAVIVAGTVTIRDLNRHFDWRLPDEEASTVAGLVLYEARRIPQIGQRFSFHGFSFEILGRQRNQITLIKLRQNSGKTLVDRKKAG